MTIASCFLTSFSSVQFSITLPMFPEGRFKRVMLVRFSDLNEARVDVKFLSHMPQPLVSNSVKCLFKVNEVVEGILPVSMIFYQN